MSLSADVTIIRQTEDARIGPDGVVLRQIRVEWMLGKHGPFTDRFPKEDFTAAVRDAQLEARARELRV